MEKKSDITIALVGNPCVGKSGLFSVLTGRGGNIGKTVEKYEGYTEHKGRGIHVVDLPGVYSLSAYTKEEDVTSSFMLSEELDVAVQVIDARNLERNLFMTVRLMEMGIPIVVAINLIDLAQERGIFIDSEKLGELLGVPVVAINVNRKLGIGELLDAVLSVEGKTGNRKIDYGIEIEEELGKIMEIISNDPDVPNNKILWLALGVLEKDKRTEDFFRGKKYFDLLRRTGDESAIHIGDIYKSDLRTVMVRARYGFVGGLAKECIAESSSEKSRDISERLDRIALDKFFGIPIFLLVIMAIFQLAFNLSQPLSDLIGKIFLVLESYMIAIMQQLDFSSWTISMVTEGVIGGAGNVLVFVPVLGILFALIAVLEDSGYMARIAYVMDQFMHKLGLHGKAFIPMVLGFGCNVPGVMATRMLENKQDRLLSILINPFMSCGSRLPTYILFAGIFFPGHQGEIILSLYALGLLMAMLVGFIFRKFIFKKLSSPFVIELPSYRFPNIKGVLVHAGERVWMFIKNAGTVIVAFSILVWLLSNLPAGAAYGSQESYAGMLGSVVSPFFAPLGFGNWQSAVALIFGVAGKEIIVGTFGTIYAGGDGDAFSLASALSRDFNPLSAYAFMVFVLFYTPCVATLATIKRETGSWRWTLFSAIYHLLIAYLMAFVIYNGGLLLGFE